MATANPVANGRRRKSVRPRPPCLSSNTPATAKILAVANPASSPITNGWTRRVDWPPMSMLSPLTLPMPPATPQPGPGTPAGSPPTSFPRSSQKILCSRNNGQPYVIKYRDFFITQRRPSYCFISCLTLDEANKPFFKLPHSWNHLISQSQFVFQSAKLIHGFLIVSLEMPDERKQPHTM